MKQVGLSVSQRIEIALVGIPDYFVSIVEDITADEIFIGVPYRGLAPLVLSPGDRVKVNFPGDGEMFTFESMVTGRREAGVPLYGLTFPEKIERIQRRRDVRLFALHEIQYAEVPTGREPPAFKKAKALDISAGGLRLVAENEYPPGTILLVKFTLPMRNSHLETLTRARVVRKEPILLDNQQLFHLGLEFVDLPQSQKDKIFSYIFWKMMEQSRLR
ncbi:MAG: PilZ domain-containing protein [Bacillota bacterium]